MAFARPDHDRLLVRGPAGNSLHCDLFRNQGGSVGIGRGPAGGTEADEDRRNQRASGADINRVWRGRSIAGGAEDRRCADRAVRQTVARKMIRAIVSPRPEVWPHGLSRVAVGICGAVPTAGGSRDGGVSEEGRVAEFGPGHVSMNGIAALLASDRALHLVAGLRPYPSPSGNSPTRKPLWSSTAS